MRTALRSSLFFCFVLTACSYNPFSLNNHTTGSPLGAAIGAGVGSGSVALLGGSRPLIAFAGITGGMFGYYTTTLRYDSGGVLLAGGTVYKVGDYVGISMPTDQLFESNSADFLPDAPLILDSAAAVLKRYPNNSIFISGNTSGFSRPRWELKLSEKRAQRVSAYLWDAGVNNFREPTNNIRRLGYVGYGNYVRIASDLSDCGIRTNSRIQITSYPSARGLGLDAKSVAMQNYGARTNYETTCDESVGRYPDGSACL